ncbi:D-arabinono-1,4-lactone oxidase [Brevibacterium album]|uniref:D-arabinono-1,4-lactone oxidase n=1 Tax=Brevibacterium album TaxID=417948 RepID=UPI0004226EC6|nr:D-arabinono-1,4-lactone oxidase [Brevibacterium album]
MKQAPPPAQDAGTARQWQNWSRTVSCLPARAPVAASLAEVREAVAAAASAGEPLRVVGAGHSFGDNVATPGTLLSLDGMKGLLDVDAQDHRVRVAAGTRLWELNEELDRHGLAMINLGDVDRQSLAGAVSTGTHGTGAGMGGLPTLVEAVELVTASGEVIECTADDPRLLRAARLTNGALGVVTAYTLRVAPAYRLRERLSTEPLDELLTRLDAEADAHRHFEFFTFPYSDSAMVKRIDLADGPGGAAGGGGTAGAGGGEVRSRTEVAPADHLTMAEAVALGRADPSRIPELNRRLSASVGVHTFEGPSHRILISARNDRFVETEWALPCAAAAAVLTEMRAFVESRNLPVNFPFEVRFVQGDEDSLLSSSYGRDTCYIAAHVSEGIEHRGFFAGLGEIALAHGGRPHWGKWHDLDADRFARLYPRWEEFQAVRRELDPAGVFANDHIRRVFGD